MLWTVFHRIKITISPSVVDDNDDDDDDDDDDNDNDTATEV